MDSACVLSGYTIPSTVHPVKGMVFVLLRYVNYRELGATNMANQNPYFVSSVTAIFNPGLSFADYIVSALFIAWKLLGCSKWPTPSSRRRAVLELTFKIPARSIRFVELLTSVPFDFFSIWPAWCQRPWNASCTFNWAVREVSSDTSRCFTLLARTPKTPKTVSNIKRWPLRICKQGVLESCSGDWVDNHKKK